MNTNLKILLFTLIVVGGYVGFANSIPQIESRPPAQTNLSGDLSPEQLAEAGEQIVTGDKGGCLTCHGLGSPGPRAPDLQDVGARAATRIPGASAEDYLRNSILDPCSFVVAGYDCLMGGMGLDRLLTKAEQTAVVAFLQSLGGQITVRLTAEELAATSGGESAGGPEFKGATGPELFAEAGCLGCHTLPAVGATGQVGPDLSEVGARLTADAIRQSILDPNAVIAADCPTGPCPSPSLMPPNFGERFTAKQLEALVDFLAALGGGTAAGPTPAAGAAALAPTAAPKPTRAAPTAAAAQPTSAPTAQAIPVSAVERADLSLPAPANPLILFGAAVSVPVLTVALGLGLAFSVMAISRLQARGRK